MNQNDSPEKGIQDAEFANLDGHTIEELSDYLEAGRTPADPAIEGSPGCRIALDALMRLRELTPDLLLADTAAEAEPDESWVQGILAGIALDARAGRRIPIASPEPDSDLGITEGAVRGVVRAAEHSVPGILIGKCRFEGEVAMPGEPVRVHVEVSVGYGEPILNLTDRLRAEINARLRAHTTLNVVGIDITVRDIQPLQSLTKENQ